MPFEFHWLTMCIPVTYPLTAYGSWIVGDCECAMFFFVCDTNLYLIIGEVKSDENEPGESQNMEQMVGL